ncbi:hypothetical protein SY88_17260 [Clostridiales bacterium PH28_bin88]|nr:hypothetical protein SY88_17260 [Clostridiales bacterium PH28_bin88]
MVIKYRWKTRWLSLLAIMLFVLLLGWWNARAEATKKPIHVVMDGRAFELGVSLVMELGQTLVPLRGIFEAMGAEVDWEQRTQTVTATRGDTTVVLQVGKGEAWVDGRQVIMDVPMRLKKGQAMVPLRFVAEALGANVNWDRSNRTITITSERDEGGTGLSGTPRRVAEIRWVSDGVLFGPVIGADGTVLAAGSGGNVLALDDEGQIKWKYRTLSRLAGVLPDSSGGAYAWSNEEKKVFHIGPDGELLWALDVPSFSEMVLAGRLVFIRGQEFWAVDAAEGKRHWSLEKSVSALQVGAGQVYFVAEGDLYAYSLDGRLKWKYPRTDTEGTFEKVTFKSGNLYASLRTGLKSNTIIALMPSGKVRWRQELHDWLTLYSVDPDGRVLIGNWVGDRGWIPHGGGEPVMGPVKQINLETAFAPGGITYFLTWHQFPTNQALAATGATGKLFWQTPIPPGRYTAGPITGPDGTVYVVSGGTLVAITPEGANRWELSLCAGDFINEFGSVEPISMTLAVRADGMIYAGDGQTVWAVSPDGKEKWRFSTHGRGTGLVMGPDGTTYGRFGIRNDQLMAIRPDGREAWRFEPGETLTFPVLGPSGIYVAGVSGRLYALDWNGRFRWIRSTRVGGQLPPQVGPSETIYQVSADREVFVFDAGGQERWRFTVPAGATSATVIPFAGGLTYITTPYGKKVFALDQEGQVQWTFPAANPLMGRPVVGSSGVLYLSESNTVYALSPAGELLWSYTNRVPFNAVFPTDEKGDTSVYFWAYDAPGEKENLHLLDREGKEKWALPSRSVSSSFIDGSIYATSQDDRWLLRFTPDDNQQVVWQSEQPIQWVKQDGDTLLIQSGDRLIALDWHGQPLWQAEVPPPEQVLKAGSSEIYVLTDGVLWVVYLLEKNMPKKIQNVGN